MRGCAFFVILLVCSLVFAALEEAIIVGLRGGGRSLMSVPSDIGGPVSVQPVECGRTFVWQWRKWAILRRFRAFLCLGLSTAVLRLQPGDHLVVYVGVKLSAQGAARIFAKIERLLKRLPFQVPVLVLDEGATLGILRPDSIKPTACAPRLPGTLDG